MSTDEQYMWRAIELARHGLGSVSPNPMVGCVIVAGGRVIGEGWHRKWGEGHAEVNAVASVAPADRCLLPEATAYVTLEPCSHYGKTPPCARLLADNRLHRVVVGSLDPFVKVSGRGVAMLRDAGVEVTVGVLEQECRSLNPTFMLAHTLGRPWVTLKWAQSADGFIDGVRLPDEAAVRFSSTLSSMLVHRLRSLHDAILVGSGTMVADRPRLTVRSWPGKSPQRFVADRTGRLDRSLTDGFDRLGSPDVADPAGYLESIYKAGCTSVLVEGGRRLLQAFIDCGLFDMVRVETAPFSLGSGVVAPVLTGVPVKTVMVGDNRIDYYRSAPWCFTEQLLNYI